MNHSVSYEQLNLNTTQSKTCTCTITCSSYSESYFDVWDVLKLGIKRANRDAIKQFEACDVMFIILPAERDRLNI